MSLWVALAGAAGIVAAALAGRQVLASSSPAWPTPGHSRISSRFGVRVDPVTGAQGENHNGIDLPAPTGSPVVAVMDGRVVRTWRGDALNGNAARVLHGRYRTSYAHLSELLVVDGQSVKRGELIGYAGSTGKSTGPHLHFGLWDIAGGRWIDPLPWLRGRKDLTS